MKSRLFILVIFLIFGCVFFSCSNKNSLKLYGNLKRLQSPLRQHNKLLVSSGMILDYYTIRYQGIAYEIGVNNDHKILFISTKDANFAVGNNIKVGTSYAELQQMGYPKGVLEKGWGYIMPLNKQWNAFLNDNQDTSKVIFLFQRGQDKKARLFR